MGRIRVDRSQRRREQRDRVSAAREKSRRFHRGGLQFHAGLRDDYRVGVPRPGFYREILNTDSGYYWGSDAGNAGGVHAEPIPWNGKPGPSSSTSPPLAAFISNPQPIDALAARHRVDQSSAATIYGTFLLVPPYLVCRKTQEASQLCEKEFSDRGLCLLLQRRWAVATGIGSVAMTAVPPAADVTCT